MFRLIFCSVLWMVLASPLASSGKYNVEGIYSVTTESGMYAKVALGGIKKVKALYIKTKINSGDYSINITRKDPNWYEIDGKGLFVHTRNCHEYGYGVEAVLKYTGGGYTAGELIFLE